LNAKGCDVPASTHVETGIAAFFNLMKQNAILLRRRNKIIVPTGTSSLPVPIVATFNKNLEALGYTLSPAVLQALGSLNEDEATELYTEVIPVLQELKGVKKYRPMYPNFPRQVMEAHAAELYLNAVVHYITAAISDGLGDKRRRFIWLPR